MEDNIKNIDTTIIESDNQIIEDIAVEKTEDGIIDESNYDAFKLLNLKSKLNDIQSMSENIAKTSKSLLDTDEEIEKFIDGLAGALTIEQINSLDDESITNLFKYNEEPIEFNLDFKGNSKKEAQFKRDYLEFRKKALESQATFDLEMEKINAELAESQEEFDRLCNTYGNVSGLIRATLSEKLEASEDDDKKRLYDLLLTTFNNGLNLKNVISYARTYKGKNIISDFHDDRKSMYVYRTYLKVIHSMNIKTDIKSFTKLEEKFLGEEYNKRPNIFLFAIMHYIASWNNKDVDKAYGLFVTQLSINLKNLFYDKFDNVEDKEIFTNAIKEVIQIIG